MADTGTVCWVLSDGRRGMKNQCLGIAEALLAHLSDLEIIVKEVHPQPPWKWFPESILGFPWPLPFLALGPDSSSLAAPWPDLLIACGRKSVAYSAAIKRRSRGKTFVVQTQDPRLSPRFFDLVVPPKHDSMSGANVFSILGSPHRVTPKKLEEGARDFDNLYSALPRPLVAALIGGNSKSHKLTLDIAQNIASDVLALTEQGYGIAMTLSRRTSPDVETLLRTNLEHPSIHIWDGSGDNPYFGMLGLADHILVTEETTNMVTEAAATGKPVHILSLAGTAPKFERFHKEMAEAGITRPFAAPLESWAYKPLQETKRVAEEVIKRRFESSIIKRES
jgi:uncharacterized protein